VLTAPAHDLPAAIVRMPTESRSSKGSAKPLWIYTVGIRHLDGGNQLI